MTGEAEANLESYGANIVITPKAEDVALTYGGIDVGGVSVGDQGLDEADLERVRSIPARGEHRRRRAGARRRGAGQGPPRLAHGRRPGGAVRAQALVVDRRRTATAERPRAHRRRQGRRGAAAWTWATTCASVASASPSRASSGRRAGRTTSCSSPGSGAVQRVLGRPGELTLIEVAAHVLRRLRRPGGAPALRGPAAGRGVHGPRGGGEPPARGGPVQGLQPRHRRHRRRHRDPRRVPHHDGLGERAHHARSACSAPSASGGSRSRGSSCIEAVVAGVIAGVLGYAAGMAVTYAVLPLLAEGAPVAWTPLLGVAAVVVGGAHRRPRRPLSGAPRRQARPHRGAARAVSAGVRTRRQGMTAATMQTHETDETDARTSRPPAGRRMTGPRASSTCAASRRPSPATARPCTPCAASTSSCPRGRSSA